MIFNVLVALSILYVVLAEFPDQRPSYEKRTYHSKSIDNLIDQLKPLFITSDLATAFSNCLPNTLDTTVSYVTSNPSAVASSDLDSFVITGDIDALWLRDSMNQVLPYVPYARDDEELQYLFEGLINRHAKSVIIDPFANAFNFNSSGAGHQSDRRTPPMKPSVFEGKYEIDSICAFLKLSYWYWKSVGDQSLVKFVDDRWLSAVQTALNTISIMQKDSGQLSNPPYLFQRLTTQSTDTLMMSGRGPPNKAIGLTRSLFRPSDDAVTLPLNIPGNAMTCVELTHLVSLLEAVKVSEINVSLATVESLITDAKSIGERICRILEGYTRTGNPLPYEIDGYGGEYFMDDANVPSLLSLPVLGFVAPSNKAYTSTRNLVLSSSNPFYYSGTAANGIGGPHVGTNFTWPMSIIMRAMTSTNEEEIRNCLDMLLKNTAGTGLMHESFNVNNGNDYTRSWFAWANGLFGELILQLIQTHPTLVLQSDPAVVSKAQSLVKPTVSIMAQTSPVVKV
jgi:meiotically up-regulated gene 157 (Mug157) protein